MRDLGSFFATLGQTTPGWGRDPPVGETLCSVIDSVLFVFGCRFLAEPSRAIERAVYSGLLVPSADWHSLTYAGANAALTYRVRVRCDANYYDASCTKLCRPRHDKFGHYTCDADGDKVCRPGWRGANCETGQSTRKMASFPCHFFLETNRGRDSFYGHRVHRERQRDECHFSFISWSPITSFIGLYVTFGGLCDQLRNLISSSLTYPNLISPNHS